MAWTGLGTLISGHRIRLRELKRALNKERREEKESVRKKRTMLMRGFEEEKSIQKRSQLTQLKAPSMLSTFFI